MHKKLTFTLCSVLLVCTALFMACEKSTNTAVNAATTGGTTGSTGANTISLDGTSHSVISTTTVIGSNFTIISSSPSSSYPAMSVYFSGSGAPAAGTYTANSSAPSAGNCEILLSPATSITWTVVTCHPVVTSGSSRNMSFTNSIFTDGTATHTVSANLPF